MDEMVWFDSELVWCAENLGACLIVSLRFENGCLVISYIRGNNSCPQEFVQRRKGTAK
jgi:hypothetical protein